MSTDRPALIVATCRPFADDFPGGEDVVAAGLHSLGLEVCLHVAVDSTFPDGELCIDLPEEARGRTVLIWQSLTGDHAEPNAAIMTLLATARCYREHGAKRIIAVVPHLAYARHDRAVIGERRPVVARLLADLLAASGVDEVVALASGAVRELSRLFEASGTCLRLLSTHGLRLAMLRPLAGRDSIILAPDRGGREEARALARELGSPVIEAEKRREGPETVTVILPPTVEAGDCRHFVFVDDLITSGATVDSAVRALRATVRDPRIDVVATHLRLTRRGVERLTALRHHGFIDRVSVTDAAGRLVDLDGLSTTPALPYLTGALGALLVRA